MHLVASDKTVGFYFGDENDGGANRLLRLEVCRSRGKVCFHFCLQKIYIYI